jgi:hypothetical protein
MRGGGLVVQALGVERGRNAQLRSTTAGDLLH